MTSQQLKELTEDIFILLSEQHVVPPDEIPKLLARLAARTGHNQEEIAQVMRSVEITSRHTLLQTANLNATRDHVAEVLRAWSGLEDLHGRDKVLRSIWLDMGQSSATYETHGINKLINKIRDDQVLGECPAARALKKGDFLGGVQSVGNLRDRVTSC